MTDKKNNIKALTISPISFNPIWFHLYTSLINLIPSLVQHICLVLTYVLQQNPSASEAF